MISIISIGTIIVLIGGFFLWLVRVVKQNAKLDEMAKEQKARADQLESDAQDWANRARNVTELVKRLRERAEK
jgi:CHASE3 domain sensor protein